MSLNSALNMGFILRGVHSEFPHKRVASSWEDVAGVHLNPASRQSTSCRVSEHTYYNKPESAHYAEMEDMNVSVNEYHGWMFRVRLQLRAKRFTKWLLLLLWCVIYQETLNKHTTIFWKLDQLTCLLELDKCLSCFYAADVLVWR